MVRPCTCSVLQLKRTTVCPLLFNLPYISVRDWSPYYPDIKYRLKINIYKVITLALFSWFPFWPGFCLYVPWWQQAHSCAKREHSFRCLQGAWLVPIDPAVKACVATQSSCKVKMHHPAWRGCNQAEGKAACVQGELHHHTSTSESRGSLSF